MTSNLLFTKHAQKYRGQYVAVAGNEVVASGKNAVEAFEIAKKILGSKKVEGVYYIPQKEDLLTALCVFPTFKFASMNRNGF